MFNWFRRKAAEAGPAASFAHVQNRPAAEQLVQRGELAPLYLVPPAFGGAEDPLNLVYVPPAVAEAKAAFDELQIRPRAEAGELAQYGVEPSYIGRSLIPSRLVVTASGAGQCVVEVQVWGPTAVSEDSPAAATMAFIADYAAWNDRAAKSLDAAPDAAEDARITESFDAMLRAHAAPGVDTDIGISFGSTSRWSPDRSRVVAVATHDAARAEVRVLTPIGSWTTDEAACDFVFVRQDGAWRLTAVHFLIDGVREPWL